MNDKKIIVAPVGDAIEDIYVGINEFPTQKVILLCPEKWMPEAEEVRKNLDKFRIPTRIIRLNGFICEDEFKHIALLKETESTEILVNVSTGDRESRCAALSAAFVNGLKAFGVEGKEMRMLPVLKFSYYKLIPVKKLKLLRIIQNNPCPSLEELGKKARMSLPLISYPINGNLKSEGLKEMGLVETEQIKGRTQVQLSFLGSMLVKGYIKADVEA
jgi:hypothetical protein